MVLKSYLENGFNKDPLTNSTLTSEKTYVTETSDRKFE